MIKGEARPHTLTAERLAHLQETFTGPEDDSKEDDTRSVAKSVLSDHKELGAVHSTRSVAAVAARKLETVQEAKPIAEPKIVTHLDDSGARLANKDSMHNLPYMNRNPSV
jgi:hypothetical protein